MTDREKPEIMRAVLTVKEKRYLSPQYIRVTLEGKDIGRFAGARPGDNNKIIVPQTPNAPIILPEFGQRSAGSRPLMRTYTMRSLDLNAGEMVIDFVGHGEEGPASRWATHAEPGSELGVLMKVKEKPLFLPADWYLLVGDHTALPVISVILESLPADARGMAILEVYSPQDVLQLKKPGKVDVFWIFNNQPGKTSGLPSYFKNTSLPDHVSKFIFVAAEHSAVNEIQQILRINQTLQRQEWQAYAYWKYGQAEDDSSKERKDISRRE